MNFKQAVIDELEKLALGYKGISFLPYGPKKSNLGLPGAGPGDKHYARITQQPGIKDALEGAFGFAYPGKNQAFIRRNPTGIRNPDTREIIAHEAFHARNPRLGQFESLAYPYGAWKSSRNPIVGGLKASAYFLPGALMDAADFGVSIYDRLRRKLRKT